MQFVVLCKTSLFNGRIICRNMYQDGKTLAVSTLNGALLGCKK
jgi:hypothetical protein